MGSDPAHRRTSRWSIRTSRSRKVGAHERGVTEALNAQCWKARTASSCSPSPPPSALKAISRAKKGEIIDRILEQTGAARPPATLGTANGNGSGRRQRRRPPATAAAGGRVAEAPPGDLAAGPSAATPTALDDEPPADWELAIGDDDDTAADATAATADAATTADGRRPQSSPGSPSAGADGDPAASARAAAASERPPTVHGDRDGDRGGDGSDGDGDGAGRPGRQPPPAPPPPQGRSGATGPQGADRPDNRSRASREPRRADAGAGQVEELASASPSRWPATSTCATRATASCG